MEGLRPIHPDEILREDFLVELKLTAADLATKTGLPIERVDALVSETAGIDELVASAFSSYFGNSAEFWINLPRSFDEQSRGKTRFKTHFGQRR
jgi:addiction module HigA family antidote